MRSAFAAAVLALAASLAASLAAAHHSVAMYDNDHLIELSGTVTRVEWTSPHVFVYFTTAGEDGATVEWSVELDPPVLLRAPLMRGAIAELADGTELRVWSRV
jgi:hypothetical protein